MQVSLGSLLPHQYECQCFTQNNKLRNVSAKSTANMDANVASGQKSSTASFQSRTKPLNIVVFLKRNHANKE